MKPSLILLSLILLSSCSHFGPKYSAAGDTAEEANRKRSFAPYEQYMAKEGVTPVADQLDDPSMKKEFIKEICNSKDNQECSSKWWQMVEAKFNVTYRQADPSWVGVQCQADLLKCKKDLRFIEQLYIQSNNAKVIKAFNDDQEVERKIAEEKSNRAWAGVFQGMGQYYQQQQNQINNQSNNQQPRVIIQPGGRQTNCYDMGNGHTQCNSNK